MNWSQIKLQITGLVCFGVLLVGCFEDVLFRGEQFAYRDAGHYYYPLYLQVQQQWETGHVPLWESGENGGMPLLGNPTAAVLYPGKLAYALLPYPSAAIAYVVSHVCLAALGAYLLSRSLAIGRSGSTIAGFSYAFGAPVLFLHSNVIYLIGAAWMPFGLRAADSWVRKGSFWGVIQLGVVLAMTTLGGDAEAAYLTGGVALAYAIGHGWADLRQDVSNARLGRLLAVIALVWILVVMFSAWWSPELSTWRAPGRYVRAGIWIGLMSLLVVLAVRRISYSWLPRIVVHRVVGVVFAGVLALLVAGVQVVPTLEVSGISVRNATEAPFDPFAFSIEPGRLLELFWPNVTGESMPENRHWVRALNPAHGQEFWTPSIYLGGGAILLALSVFTGGGPAPGRLWMGMVAVVALVGSLGSYGGPLWLLRQISILDLPLGWDDGPDAVGQSSSIEDSFGSLYWMMMSSLPGFEAFRYPAKLMVPAALAISVLAGMGWEQLIRGKHRPLARVAIGAIVCGTAALIVSSVFRSTWIEHWDRSANVLATLAGPLDAMGAFDDLRVGLVHGVAVCCFALGLATWARRYPIFARHAALLGVTFDLLLANAGLVWTVPQSLLDRAPAVWRRIQEAEREQPSDGPFRVHRMPVWYPEAFFRNRSPNRLAEIVSWERDTLQPSHGLSSGLEYVFSPGLLEPIEFVWFFRPSLRNLDSSKAIELGMPNGRPVLYYPRRSADIWNARYFVLPANPGDWLDQSRGIASFLDRSTRLAPDVDALRLEGGEAEVTHWRTDRDWQLLRNEATYPRAWVVHDARLVDPVSRSDTDSLAREMQRLLFQNDRIWNDPMRPVINLRTTALIESRDPNAVKGYLSTGGVSNPEQVRVVSHEPGRVELIAELERPGLVILADVYFPGWRLRIDGERAPILRANRMMRGAAVDAGRHRLVYTYEPWSVQLGWIATLAGLLLTGALSCWTWMRPPKLDKILGSPAESVGA